MEFEHGFINGNPVMVLRNNGSYDARLEMRNDNNLYSYVAGSKEPYCIDYIIARLHGNCKFYPCIEEYESLKDLIQSDRYQNDQETRSYLAIELIAAITRHLDKLGFLNDMPGEGIYIEMIVFAGRLIEWMEISYIGHVFPYSKIDSGDDLGTYDINNQKFYMKGVSIANGVDKARAPKIIDYHEKINPLIEI